MLPHTFTYCVCELLTSNKQIAASRVFFLGKRRRCLCDWNLSANNIMSNKSAQRNKWCVAHIASNNIHMFGLIEGLRKTSNANICIQYAYIGWLLNTCIVHHILFIKIGIFARLFSLVLAFCHLLLCECVVNPLACFAFRSQERESERKRDSESVVGFSFGMK